MNSFIFLIKRRKRVNPVKFKGDFKFDDKWFLRPEKSKKSSNYFIEKYNLSILQKSKKNDDFINLLESMRNSDIEDFLFQDFDNNLQDTKLYFGKRKIFLKEYNKNINLFMLVKENNKSIDFEFRIKAKYISDAPEDTRNKNSKSKIKKDLKGIAMNILKMLEFENEKDK